MNTQVEKQYQESIIKIKEQGHERLGLMSSWAWIDDPKRLAFTFARYKFVAKMLEGRNHVLEIGCGDAFASRIVRQSVNNLTGIDIDPSFIEDANSRNSEQWPISCKHHNILESPVAGNFDGAYSLDVMEHIPREQEDIFIKNILQSITSKAIVIIGMPSLQSQPYASAQSKMGHINCKDQKDFKQLMEKYFDYVFMFAMNDEVLHTGYHAMAHYNFALCCEKRHQV